MNRLISTCLAVSAIALIAPNSANAAAISINDAGTEGSIVFSANDFEGGISLDGTLLQSGLNNLQSRTVSEGTAGAPITHTFSGTWLTPGGLTPSTQTIAFQEGSTPTSAGVSDILTLAFSNTTLGGAAAGTDDAAHAAKGHDWQGRPRKTTAPAAAIRLRLLQKIDNQPKGGA